MAAYNNFVGWGIVLSLFFISVVCLLLLLHSFTLLFKSNIDDICPYVCWHLYSQKMCSESLSDIVKVFNSFIAVKPKLYKVMRDT